MTDFALARRNMIDGQLRPNRVTNAQLLAAIGDLPRERFLPTGLRSVAYADDDVPLGNGRFLMEPMVLARLIQTLQPRREDQALVVASGAGLRRGAFGTAREVRRGGRERTPALAGSAEQTIRNLGIADVQQIVGKMEEGCAAQAPYDVILIEGAVQTVPPAILDQLAEGGRLGTVIAAPDRRAGRGPAHGEGRRRRLGPSAVRRRDAASAGFRAAAALHFLIVSVSGQLWGLPIAVPPVIGSMTYEGSSMRIRPSLRLACAAAVCALAVGLGAASPCAGRRA